MRSIKSRIGSVILLKTKTSTYICLEGLKGSGKTTLFNYLIEKLEENQVDFSTVSPTRAAPPDFFFERLIRQRPSLRDNRLVRIFLYAARSNHAAKIADWSKPLVLGERSLITSYATKWSSNRWSRRFHLQIINLFENKIKSPDIVVYIDVPHSVLRKRIDTRNKERDIDDTATRLREMELAYKSMMANYHLDRIKNTEWIILEGDKELATLGDELYELIVSHMR